MKLKDMIVMCLSNLFKRKVRTLLTVMGVVIGTCAIVVMISLGLGMQKTTEEALAQMGDLTVIQIYNWSGSTEIPPLDDSMLKTFKEHQYVEATMPVYQGEGGQYTIKSGKYAYDGMIYGVYMEDLAAFGYQLTDGSFPTGEAGGEENYILFGSQAPYDFYNTKKNMNNRVDMIPDAEGNLPDPFVDVMKDKLEIEINKQDDENKKKAPVYKIKTAGIMAEDWSKNPSPSYSVFMDMNFLKKLQIEYNKLNNVKVDKNKKDTGYQQVMVKVDDIKHVAEVEEVIKSYGYETNSMESIRKPIEEQAKSQQMILGGLGAISLLVAALGITNTMIMSIYERTREIGVMKVLGCMIKNIRTVFLMEAGTIGFIGGVIGVGISYIISFIINSISAAGAGGGDMYGMMMGGGGLGGSSIIPLWLVIGAIAFATMIGLVSGFYPANRAVKISALTAIKQE